MFSSMAKRSPPIVPLPESRFLAAGASAVMPTHQALMPISRVAAASASHWARFHLQLRLSLGEALPIGKDGPPSSIHQRSLTLSLNDKRSLRTAHQDNEGHRHLGRKELIRSAVKRNLYGHVIKDERMAAIAVEAEQDAYSMLKGVTNRKKSSGFIKPRWF